MGWLETMNNAMAYIEKHLCDKTDYEQIARVACCSPYHFQRMFTFLSGVTLSEYIRRRRMTLAAFDLLGSDIKIIDLAYQYGYESPEAFTRAFQSLHGLSPTAARKRGAPIKAYPRISLQLTVKGGSEMYYKIIERPAFQVYGIEGMFDMKDGENLRTIPAFWTEQITSGAYLALMQSANVPGNVNAVCGYRPMEGTRFPYMLCMIKTPLSDTDGYTVVDVPAATWAVFRGQPHTLEEISKETQSLVSRVYTEWLPTAGFDLIEGFDFEMYFSTMDGRCYEEAWFRVRAK